MSREEQIPTKETKDIVEWVVENTRRGYSDHKKIQDLYENLANKLSLNEPLWVRGEKLVESSRHIGQELHLLGGEEIILFRYAGFSRETVSHTYISAFKSDKLGTDYLEIALIRPSDETSDLIKKAIVEIQCKIQSK